MKNLQQIAANLEKIALLDQQILRDDMQSLGVITTNLEKFASLDQQIFCNDMQGLKAITANLEEITSLNQQILCNDLGNLDKILRDTQKISDLPPLIQKRTFLRHVLKLDQRENKISDILAFFFDPKEEHPYFDLFLTTLAECLKNGPDWIWYLNQKNFKAIERERTFKEIDSKKRIDLVFYFEDLILGIEHKIHAKLDNDLKTYRRGLQKIAIESKRKAELIVLSLNKCPAEELKDCINITYKEFYVAVRKNYKPLNKNKENSQSDLRWQGIFEDFLISMENLIGVYNMTEKQRERQYLIWELFTKNNMASIIEEYKENIKSVFQGLEEDFRQTIEEFDFEEAPNAFLEWDTESQKICAFFRFQTKEKTILVLGIDNCEGEFTASLMQWYEDENNNKEVLRAESHSSYDLGNGYRRRVRVNGDLLCKKIDSNPYADDFTEKVLAACEGILETLAKALKD